jgi:hypothetical protein
MTYKTCTVCNSSKHISEYHNRTSASDGKCYRCKSCDAIARNKWRVNNIDRAKRSDREKLLKNRYNISLKEYETLLEKQNFTCAICRQQDSTKSLAVDHDHITGNIRGLLCSSCNRGLGLLGDSVEAIKDVLKYLETH